MKKTIIIIALSDLDSNTIDSEVTVQLWDLEGMDYLFNWSVISKYEIIEKSIVNTSQHSDGIERWQECLKFKIEYEKVAF
jgi:hypothetical protein